jgi:hypothetical protein
MRAAAFLVAEEVQDLQLLGGVKKAVEERSHELEILGIATENRKEELASTQTELETTKLEVERNRENLIVLGQLQRYGQLPEILAKVKEYDYLARAVNIERLRQTVGQNNNNGQTVNQPPVSQGQTVNQPTSVVDQIWALIEQK